MAAPALAFKQPVKTRPSTTRLDQLEDLGPQSPSPPLAIEGFEDETG